MTVFRVQGLLATQLVLDLPAVTTRLVAGFEVWVVVMDAVGGSKFPLVLLAFSARVVGVFGSAFALVLVGTSAFFGHL